MLICLSHCFSILAALKICRRDWMGNSGIWSWSSQVLKFLRLRNTYLTYLKYHWQYFLQLHSLHSELQTKADSSCLQERKPWGSQCWKEEARRNVYGFWWPHSHLKGCLGTRQAKTKHMFQFMLWQFSSESIVRIVQWL